MEAQHVYAVHRVTLTFCGSVSVAVECDRRKNFFRKRDGFFCSCDLSFFAKKYVPSQPNNVSVGFCPLN